MSVRIETKKQNRVNRYGSESVFVNGRRGHQGPMAQCFRGGVSL